MTAITTALPRTGRASHSIYEAELVGLMLAAALLQQLDFLEEVTITIDSQAAIKAIMSFCSSLGQQLTDTFLQQMSELAD